MESYVVHAHGFEDTCSKFVSLLPGEYILMHCTHGCTLYVQKLFNEFIQRHLMKAKNADEFLLLMKKPESAGKKYAKLEAFLNKTFCLFEDQVPNISLDMSTTQFRTGLFKLPVKGPQEKWNDIAIDSYSDLYDVITEIRMVNKEKGFLLALFTCREYTYYEPPQGKPIQDIHSFPPQNQ
jgi:hypothetical protein